MNTITDIASGFVADRSRDFIRTADHQRAARAARKARTADAVSEPDTTRPTSRRSGRGDGRTTTTVTPRWPVRRWRLRPLNFYQQWLAAGRL